MLQPDCPHEPGREGHDQAGERDREDHMVKVTRQDAESLNQRQRLHATCASITPARTAGRQVRVPALARPRPSGGVGSLAGLGHAMGDFGHGGWLAG